MKIDYEIEHRTEKTVVQKKKIKQTLELKEKTFYCMGGYDFDEFVKGSLKEIPNIDNFDTACSLEKYESESSFYEEQIKLFTDDLNNNGWVDEENIKRFKEGKTVEPHDVITALYILIHEKKLLPKGNYLIYVGG